MNEHSTSNIQHPTSNFERLLEIFGPRNVYAQLQRHMDREQEARKEPPHYNGRCRSLTDAERDAFLSEVQYQGRWADDINLLEDGLPARLHLLFAVHPWVESVKSVQIVPPRGVRCGLRALRAFRASRLWSSSGRRRRSRPARRGTGSAA